MFQVLIRAIGKLIDLYLYYRHDHVSVFICRASNIKCVFKEIPI